MFLGLIDIAITNSYILWKLTKPGNSMTKSDYYYAIAEGMITYEGFRSIGNRTRLRGSTPTTTPTREPRDKPSTPTVINIIQEDHTCMEFLPKPKTRPRRLLDQDGRLKLYGYGGYGGKSRECFVCRKLSTKKRKLTKYYCNMCGVPVCHVSKLTEGVDGNLYSCWNALHSGKVSITEKSREAAV
jgi:hypothetical protein